MVTSAAGLNRCSSGISDTHVANRVNQTIFGTIHKQRRQFFQIFETPLPHVDSFLVLSVGNFDQFLTPPPLPITDIVYGWPLSW